MKQDQKKFHQYSLSFYQKQHALVNVTNRVKMGFNHLDKNDNRVKSTSIDKFMKFNQCNKTGQKQLLQDDAEGYMEAFFEIIKTLESDRELMEYVLPTVDAILTQERTVLRKVIEEITAGKYPNLISKLKGFLPIEDQREVIYIAVARIISILLGQLPKERYFNDMKTFLLDLLSIKRSSLKQKISDYGLVTCFVHLIKHSELAEIFLDSFGINILVDCLNKSGNDIQLIYYALLNIWMISFLESGVQKCIGVAKLGIIKSICEILQKVSREKITRIAFTIFKNIEGNNNCLELMMDNKLLKIVDTILKGNIKDEDLINSIKDIGAILESNIRVLSSFDKYVKEINGQMLEWSSVHTERFWKENAIKFEASDYQLIKKLKYLLGSKKKQNIAIACYDLGQFCRFYPRGKVVIQSQQIKDIIMEKAKYDEDKSVRQQALLSLQKIMIQNWQAI